MGQMPRGKHAARPAFPHLGHQLCDAPSHRIAVVSLVEVDERRQRPQQRARLKPVDLEASADECKTPAALVNDYITWACPVEHVLRVDRGQRQVACEREGSPAWKDNAVPCGKPDSINPVDRQPADTGRHNMAFDRPGAIAKPDRPRAARVEAGREIAFGF